MISKEEFERFQNAMFDRLDGIESLNRQVFDSYQAAHYLSISYDSFRREVRLGNFIPSSYGSKDLFTKEDLDWWVKSKRGKKLKNRKRVVGDEN